MQTMEKVTWLLYKVKAYNSEDTRGSNTRVSLVVVRRIDCTGESQMLMYYYNSHSNGDAA